MRILCCVNRDLESNYALNLLLPELAKHTVRVVLSERVGQKPAPLEVAALRAIEQGLPNEILFPILERFVPRGGRALTFSELAAYCGGNVPLVTNLNDAAGIELLRSFAPDLIVTIRYGRILKPAAIGASVHGVVNLHSGILPQYRGILSTLYAIIDGASDIGCTLHWIVDAEIDTGPIIAIARRPIEQGRSLLWHIMSLYPLGVPLIVETVRRLTSGDGVPRTPQEAGAGTYRSFPSGVDVRALRARGVELFDATDLRDLVAQYLPHT